MSAPKVEQNAPDRPGGAEVEWLAVANRPTVNLSLRQIMLLLGYCSVLSLIGRYVYLTPTPVMASFLVIMVGAGVAYLGVWLVPRLGRFGFVGWVVFVLGFAMMSGAAMGVLAIPAVVVLVAVLVGLHVQHRRVQQGGLLWVLAVAADRGIPLAPGVEAYAQQSAGVYRDRVAALAAGLRRGQSLSTAVGRINRVVPWDASLLIRVGEEVGRLGAALRIAAEARSRRQPSIRVVFDRAGYLIVVLLVMEIIIGATIFFIIPKLDAIYRDLGLPLPAPTRVLHSVGQANARNLLLFGLGQLMLAAYVVFMLGGQGLQGIPILGRMFRLRHKSLLLRSLALVIEADRPLAMGFAILASEYPSPRVRRRVREAAEVVQTGGDWIAALRGVGLLGAADVGVLEASSRAGNLPWAIRTLAEAGERRLAYRLIVASQYAFVGAIVALGALVLGVSVALFLPLVDMIERMS